MTIPLSSIAKWRAASGLVDLVQARGFVIDDAGRVEIDGNPVADEVEGVDADLMFLVVDVESLDAQGNRIVDGAGRITAACAMPYRKCSACTGGRRAGRACQCAPRSGLSQTPPLVDPIASQAASALMARPWR